MGAVVAAVLALVFAWVVFTRFTLTGRSAFAAWSSGLAIFAAAATCQAIGERIGFGPALFRAFYLLGGVLGVIWLAMGTLFLLAPGRVARIATALLAVLTLLLAIDASLVPVDQARLGSSAGVLGEAISHGSLLQVGAVVLNIAGTVILVGGSAFSGYRLWRDRAGVDRVVCNALLTAGAFVIAAGFSAAKIAGGSLDTLGVDEAIGVAVMFVGFLSLGRVGVHRAVPATDQGDPLP